MTVRTRPGRRSTPAAHRQAGIEPDEYGTIELSAENINLLDGDLLFLEVREDATGHADSPLWETLGVVQADNVVTVGNHWEYGGAVAAREVIADLRAALALARAAPTSLTRPTFERVESDGHTAHLTIRGTCCLYYQSQLDDEPTDYCSSCPLGDDATRRLRQQHWLQRDLALE